MPLRFSVIFCLILLIAVPIAFLWANPGIPNQEESDVLTRLCVVQSPEINENSGIVRSQSTEDAIWTINDSGGSPKAYLFSSQSGKTLATADLVGAKNRDWEDIASFSSNEQNFIVVADVGDNLKTRQTCQLLIFPEPELEPVDHDDPDSTNFEIKDWTQINFEYADGPRDCEAVTVDIANRQIILFEKIFGNRKGTPGIYLLELPDEPTDKIVSAKRIGELPIKNITAMDISKDARRIIARTYVEGLLFVRDENQTWTEAFRDNQPKRFALPLQRQGEGICFAKDETKILCSSEFKKAPLWQMQIEDSE